MFIHTKAKLKAWKLYRGELNGVLFYKRLNMSQLDSDLVNCRKSNPETVEKFNTWYRASSRLSI